MTSKRYLIVLGAVLVVVLLSYGLKNSTSDYVPLVPVHGPDVLEIGVEKVSFESSR